MEIKSRPGRLTGDTGTWTWVHEGRVVTEDNPLLLANRKAKKLKSLLQHQKALRGSRVPYIELVIFLSAPGLRCDLSGAARTGVYLRDNTEREGYPDSATAMRLCDYCTPLKLISESISFLYRSNSMHAPCNFTASGLRRSGDSRIVFPF